jgi:Flp pilus assembly protein TadG
MRRLQAWWADRKGAAAVEFVMVLAFLVIPIVNVIDFGMFVFEGMELHAAADAAAEAALETCGWTNELPATGASSPCTNRQSAENAAAQSTSLGSGVTITNSEGYYCIVTSGSNAGTLQPVGTFPTDYPGDCSSAGGSASDRPGDYIEVTASYTYVPPLTGISLVSTFDSTRQLQKTVWMRLR